MSPSPLIDKTGGKSRKILQVQKEKDVSLASIKPSLKSLGQDFSKNSISIDVTREDVNLTGYVCLPTYARASNAMQYFFVNSRQVRDKQLIGHCVRRIQTSCRVIGFQQRQFT